MRGVYKRSVPKLARAVEALRKRGELDQYCVFFNDHEMSLILAEAERNFGLTEKEQDNELFFSAARNALQDHLQQSS